MQKALDAAPNRRDLKVKLLEVFFVWGNKDAFLRAAQSLRKEIGKKADPDWDKVVIMGKQICPDERPVRGSRVGRRPSRRRSAKPAIRRSISRSTKPRPAVASISTWSREADGDATDFDLESSGTCGSRRLRSQPRRNPPGRARPNLDDSLDIGERTAAGLEAAFFELGDADRGRQRARRRRTCRSTASPRPRNRPTIESPGSRQRLGGRRPSRVRPWTSRPTRRPSRRRRSRARGPIRPTMETPTVETPFRGEPSRRRSSNLRSCRDQGDLTAEIDLDDLGSMSRTSKVCRSDLGDLPIGRPAESDTREQPALRVTTILLSATGVTQGSAQQRRRRRRRLEQARRPSSRTRRDAARAGLRRGTSTLTGTEVLEHRFEFDDESGDTSLVKSLREARTTSSISNLDDLSAALHGADTVEQPRSSSFSSDVFGGGETPLDLDIGADLSGATTIRRAPRMWARSIRRR